jgi:imidazolonepropionase-like amidohydrolase
MNAMKIVLVALLVSCAVNAQNDRVTAIKGVTLIDGTARPPMQNVVIVIEGSRISQIGPPAAVLVPAGATIIDGQGKFVIPGLADMHHHLRSGSTRLQQDARSNLRRMLAVGVTTVFNPSIPLKEFAALKTAAADDAAPFARFFATGPIISVKGDFFAQMVGGPMPDTPQQAQAVVNDLKAAGVDALKVQYDDVSWSMKQGFPVVKRDVLQALIAEAHRQDLKVFAHAPMLKHAKEALRAGLDGLMHGIIDEPVDQEFIDLMKKNRASYVSTMTLFNDMADVNAFAQRQAPSWDRAALQPPRLYEFFASPAGAQRFNGNFNNLAFTREHLPTQKNNLKKVFDAAIPVVLGTDTGFEGVLIGVATQIELELLVEAGLTPNQALGAATINAARMIGREKDLGTVEAGKLADLVILDADPLQDIRNVTRIFRTMKGGSLYEPVDPARAIP